MTDDIDPGRGRLEKKWCDRTLVHGIIFGSTISDLDLMAGPPPFSNSLQHSRMAVVGLLGLRPCRGPFELCPEGFRESDGQASQGGNDVWIALVEGAGK